MQQSPNFWTMSRDCRRGGNGQSVRSIYLRNASTTCPQHRETGPSGGSAIAQEVNGPHADLFHV